MDYRLLTLDQAADILRHQWEEGNAEFYEVARRVSPSTVKSLMELLLVDAQAAFGAGFTRDAAVYIQHFPELEPYREEIEGRLTSMYSQLSHNSIDPTSAVSDMYSADSIAIQELKSDSKNDDGLPRHSLAQSIANREVPFAIGNFSVETFIGEGGFATVWAGRDKRLGRKVAIKIPHESKGNHVKGFNHEGEVIARLDHPNIVRLLQADETEDGIFYLVYEYVDGETLEERIKNGDHTISEYVHWIASIAEALNYAHLHEIIHRDVSPRNIMITKTGVARLLDFGLASMNGEFYVEDEGRVLGTPFFMSPEQASRNPHWATSYSDQFSLGSVLYYALTKKLPFTGKSPEQILEKIQKAAPASLRSVQADIPIKLEKACLRALAKEPEKRYSTAADMAKAIIKSLEVPANPTSPTTTPATTYSLLAFSALLIVFGIAVSAVGLRGLLLPSGAALTIEKFDVKAIMPGPRQISLFEDRPRAALKFTNPLSLTIFAKNIDRKNSRFYLFNYLNTNGNPVEQWSSIEVEGPATTVDHSMFRPGPNVLLLVSSTKILPESSDTADFLPKNPIVPQSFLKVKSHVETEKEVRLDEVVYLFQNHVSFKNKDYQKYVLERGPGKETDVPGTSGNLRQLEENWRNGYVRFNKGELGDYAYCGIAIWIDQEPVAGTP